MPNQRVPLLRRTEVQPNQSTTPDSASMIMPVTGSESFTVRNISKPTITRGTSPFTNPVNFFGSSLASLSGSIANLPFVWKRNCAFGPGTIQFNKLVQKILPVQRISLRWSESCVADNSPQFFFRRAVRYTRGADHIFFQHHRAHVVAAKPQAHLADL